MSNFNQLKAIFVHYLLDIDSVHRSPVFLEDIDQKFRPHSMILNLFPLKIVIKGGFKLLASFTILSLLEEVFLILRHLSLIDIASFSS
jgi:hypothetical protein